MDFGVEILKTEVWIWNLDSQNRICVNFQLKRITFLAQICPKMDFGVKSSKT